MRKEQEFPKRKDHVILGAVHRESWLDYLQLYMRRDPDKGTMTFNGIPMSDTSKRAVFRWVREGATPTWDTVDRFLCRFDLIWTDFEIFCFLEKKPLWKHGPPLGYEEDE
jgi:hypothetical protein